MGKLYNFNIDKELDKVLFEGTFDCSKHLAVFIL